MIVLVIKGVIGFENCFFLVINDNYLEIGCFFKYIGI